MTPFEITYTIARPFLPVLVGTAYRELRRLAKTTTPPVQILDVGGRKSPYTIGLDAQVTVLDIPRQNEVQEQLNLGLTDRLLVDIKRRRTNIHRIILEDMTRCSLPSASFDGVACVEVIEHVREDEKFVEQIARIIKPGGWLYLTTPNGDYVRNEPPNYNPDHVRHFTRAHLEQLLKQHFDDVRVRYGIRTGRFRKYGLKNMSPTRPLVLLGAMACNLVNRVQSSGVEAQARRTAHLFAIARKMPQ